MERGCYTPTMVLTLHEVYERLLAAYGERGWWPVTSLAGTRGFDERGYHPCFFYTPNEASQRFEIAVGAILTQNAAWTNAAVAVLALERAGLLSPSAIAAAEGEALAATVRPSGYYNQKAKKLVLLSRFFLERGSLETGVAPDRGDLLSLWGVGPETADSILLYAFGFPVFVVDAYTRRIFSRLGLVDEKAPYESIRAFFEENLAGRAPSGQGREASGRAKAARPPTKKTGEKKTEFFNEYHALIVEHAKRFCRKTPGCAGCPLRADCKFDRN
jgi:endonuclease III related protein